MNKLFGIIFALLICACTAVKERLAIKECKFSLVSVRAYDFDYSDLKLDFAIEINNPNKADAVLDKFTYSFYADENSVFSGTTGQSIKVAPGKSKTFLTTITLEYKKIGGSIIDAITMGKAVYKMKGQAYVKTMLGEISYPVEITLK